jgi:hypothetical protein
LQTTLRTRDKISKNAISKMQLDKSFATVTLATEQQPKNGMRQTFATVSTKRVGRTEHSAKRVVKQITQAGTSAFPMKVEFMQDLLRTGSRVKRQLNLHQTNETVRNNSFALQKRSQNQTLNNKQTRAII